MPDFSAKFAQFCVKALGPHGPDALLAALLFAGVVQVSWWSESLLETAVIGVVVLVLYALYGWRKNRDDLHRERMAETNVKRIEAETAKLRERNLEKIERPELIPPKPPSQTSARVTQGSRRGSQR